MTKTVNAPGQLGLALSGGAWHPPLFHTSAWRPPDLATLPSWRGAKRVGIDTEAKDPTLVALGPGTRRGARMVGVSFAIEDGPKHYLPFGHEAAEDNLPPSNCVRYLRDQFREFDGEIVGANLPYDLDMLWQAGIEMPRVRRFLDVQVADPLLYELHHSYSLQSICERRNLEGKNETLLRQAAAEYGYDPKSDLWRMPARMVGEYAEDDAERPLRIMRKQEREIEEQGIQDSWDMECRLLPLLVRMTRRGVRVDEDRLERIARWCDDQEREACEIIQRESGAPFAPGLTSNASAIERVCAGIGLRLGVTASGKVSTAADVFDGVDHPAARAMLVAKKVATIRSTFVNGVRDHLVRGRMHCTFNQIRRTDDKTGERAGVAYGRLSSSHVNMQNQPGSGRSRPGDSTGHMWRSIYLPEEGEHWGACDLKQQEPKWSFDFAARLKLKGAEEACQKLRDNPRMDTYMPIVEMAGVTRGTAKICWLSYAYGKSDGNLCGTDPPFGLGLPTWMAVYDLENHCHEPADSERGQFLRQRGAHVYKRPGPEGAAIIEKLNAGVPFLKDLQKWFRKRAEQKGYIKLLDGRRCHFERDSSGKYMDTHAALNRAIQGTSAQQTKRIMLAVADADASWERAMLLQVHDELDFSVPRPETASDIAKVMSEAVPMLVPTVVDVETGPSWGESMELEYFDAEGKVRKRKYEWELY